MVTDPQTIQKKYSRLRILAIVLVLLSIMTLVYGRIQRSLAIRFEELNVQLEIKNNELQKQVATAIDQTRQAQMAAEEQKRLAMENLENCEKSKRK